MQNKSRKKQSNMGNRAPRDFKMVQAMEKVTAMGPDYCQQLARCVQENAHRRQPYWIMFNGQWTDNHQALRMNFVPWGRKPPELIGTIVYSVDNVKGRLKEEWVLLHDAPAAHLPDNIKDSQIIPEIAERAKRLPLVH